MRVVRSWFLASAVVGARAFVNLPLHETVILEALRGLQLQLSGACTLIFITVSLSLQKGCSLKDLELPASTFNDDRLSQSQDLLVFEFRMYTPTEKCYTPKMF